MNLEHGTPFTEWKLPGRAQERRSPVEVDVDVDDDATTDVVGPALVEVADVAGEEITTTVVSPPAQREQGVLPDTKDEVVVAKGFRGMWTPPSPKTREESVLQHDVRGDDVVLPALPEIQSEDLQPIVEKKSADLYAFLSALGKPAVRNKLRSLGASVYARDGGGLDRIAKDDTPEAAAFRQWYQQNQDFDPRQSAKYTQALEQLTNRDDDDDDGMSSPRYLGALQRIQSQMEAARDVKDILSLGLAMRDAYDQTSHRSVEERDRLLYRATEQKVLQPEVPAWDLPQRMQRNLSGPKFRSPFKAVLDDALALGRRNVQQSNEGGSDMSSVHDPNDDWFLTDGEQEGIEADLAQVLGYGPEQIKEFRAYRKDVWPVLEHASRTLPHARDLSWGAYLDVAGRYAQEQRHEAALPVWTRAAHKVKSFFGLPTRLGSARQEFEDVRAQVDDILAASHHAGPGVEQQEITLLNKRNAAREKRQARRSFFDRVLTRGKQE